MKIYGTMLCKDCVACVQTLQEAKIPFEFCEFEKDLENLKAFLRLRDTNPLFEPARIEGKIGIPCIVLDDGLVTLDWEQLVNKGTLTQ